LESETPFEKAMGAEEGKKQKLYPAPPQREEDQGGGGKKRFVDLLHMGSGRGKKNGVRRF